MEGMAGRTAARMGSSSLSYQSLAIGYQSSTLS
jgi:hypothetical protein